MSSIKPSHPPRQYLSAEHVLGAMCDFGSRRLEHLGALHILVLGLVAGGFITAGALFSVLLAQGVETPGVKRLVEGVGFSTGFFFVVLSEAVLFTEANVVLPAVLLYRGHRERLALRVGRFWALAWIGNLLGAAIVGALVMLAQSYPEGMLELLGEIVHRKMAYAREGTLAAWLLALLSGILANWLVGMAAFFATMGRTIFGKYIPVALAVTLFVSANFQHSPANMGYFALSIASGAGPGVGEALWWNVVPAGIGNMIGGAFLVALPFWFALRPEEREDVMRGDRQATSTP